VTVPLYNLTDTWNDGGTTFDAIKMDVTNTASAAGSSFLNLLSGGTSVFKVAKQTSVGGGTGLVITAEAPNSQLIEITPRNATVGAASFTLGGAYHFDGPVVLGIAVAAYLQSDAAHTLALRFGASAQTFRIYNTFSDLSNYERLSLNWSSNVLYIKNENAGTGSARLMVPVTGSTTVASLPSASTAGAGARSFVTDATVTTFMTTVAGGGSNAVPVVSDGTNWKIG
jgi:hypothetical protein